MASVDQLTSAQKQSIHEQILGKNLFNIIKEHVKERSSMSGDMSAEEMQEISQERREMIIPLLRASISGVNGGHSAEYPYEFDESDGSGGSGSGGNGGAEDAAIDVGGSDKSVLTTPSIGESKV